MNCTISTDFSQLEETTNNVVAFEQNQPSTTECEWATPEALPSELPDVIPFNETMLPESIRNYATSVAESMNVPLDYVGVTMMQMLSACLGNKVAALPKQNADWKVYPNLWGAIIASPGSKKSPAIKKILRPMEKIERRLQHENNDSLRDFEERVKKYDELSKKSGLTGTKPEKPRIKRIMISDATPEKLGIICKDNPNGLMLYRDELSGILEGLRKGGREHEKTFLLEAWNGDGSYSVDRMSRDSIYVPRLCLSLFGTIQPEILSKYFNTAEAGDGFLARFALLCMPNPVKPKIVDIEEDQEAYKQYEHVIESFFKMEPAGPEAAKTIRFTQEATGLFLTWLLELEEEISSGTLPTALQAHFNKYPKAITAIALIHELVDNPNATSVSEGSFSKALTWYTYLKSHAFRVYRSKVSPEVKACRILGHRIRAGAFNSMSFTKRDLSRKAWSGLTDSKTLSKAIETLEDCHWIKTTNAGTPGKPSLICTINPKVFELPE